MINGSAEAILQLFFAAEDFLPGLLAGEEGQTGMGAGVGADPVTRGEPIPNLGFIHQRIGLAPFAGFPIAGLANPIGHKVVNRTASKLCHAGQGLLPVANKAVVEGDGNLAERRLELG